MERSSRKETVKRIILFAVVFAGVLASVLLYALSTGRFFRQQAYSTVKKTSVETVSDCDFLVGYASSSLNIVANALGEIPEQEFLLNHDRLLSSFVSDTPFDYLQFVTSYGILTMPDRAPFSVRDKQYFTEGMKGFSGIWVNYKPEFTDQVVVDFYAPVFFDGEVRGVLLGVMKSTSRLQEMLQAYFYDNNMVGILLDQEFGVIASTDEIMHHGVQFKDYRDQKVIADIIEHGLMEDTEPFRYKAENGREGSVCVMKSSKVPWYIVEFVTPSSLNEVLGAITSNTYVFLVAIILLLAVYAVFEVLRNRHSSASIQKSHLNLIEALGSSFQNLFVVNSRTSVITIYNTNEKVSKKYDSVFSQRNYESSFLVYAQHEVYPDDRQLFNTISSVTKVSKLLENTNEYSFVYRVQRDGDLHYFQCMLYKPREESENFIITFKNVDNIVSDSVMRQELESIQEALKSGQWNIDYDSGYRIIDCHFNDIIRRMLGYTDHEDFPDEINSWINLVHPAERETVLVDYKLMLDDVKGLKTFDVTHRILTKTRGYRWFRVAARITRRTDGSPNHLTGFFIDVTESQQQLNNLTTMAGIYLTVYSINIEDDTWQRLDDNNSWTSYLIPGFGARKQIESVCSMVKNDEDRQRFTKFTNLDTLPERLAGKRSIYMDLEAGRLGWVRCTFIPLAASENGRISEVIITSQPIEREKRREEILIKSARTDELTKLLNRRAYEDKFSSFKNRAIPADFVYISLDVNGLKNINDTLGHEAGDEYIKGAASCMDKCFSQYGNVYRTGGDEFIAILKMTQEQLASALEEFRKLTLNWSGNQVKELSISLGCVQQSVDNMQSISAIAKEADVRMYKNKSLYYAANGMDRRGHQEAYEALCNLYTKILKVNLTTDSYSVIQMNRGERLAEKGFVRESISSWLRNFAESGQVMDDDTEEYLEKTDINYLRNYFRKGNQQLVIYYNRRYDSEFRKVIMQIIPAKEYTDESQEVFLYVKEISR